MLKRDETSYIEDQAQIDALVEFVPKIRETLRDYRERKQLSSITKILGIHQPRLTEMITRNDKGEYKKQIPPYYLANFIDSGIMDGTGSWLEYMVKKENWV